MAADVGHGASGGVIAIGCCGTQSDAGIGRGGLDAQLVVQIAAVAAVADHVHFICKTKKNDQNPSPALLPL